MNELKSLLLRAPRLRLATAESLTAGHVQARIASVTGASEFFLGGVTAYTLEQKVKHLGVDRLAASTVDCVSAEVAGQMARGALTMFGSDLAVATTGYAEPATVPKVTVPFAWWALAWRQPEGNVLLRHGRVDCPGLSRVGVQEAVTSATLTALVDWLRAERR